MKPLLAIIVGLLLVSYSPSASAQTDVEKTVRENDRLFWIAYNRCDLEAMHQFVADDVEFYHDVAGVEKGWEMFAETTRKNLCSNPDWHLRREAVAESVKVYPMNDNGKPYGAVMSGEHKFFINETAKKERWSGTARFTHLWLLRDGQWKMARILSYDHRAAPYENSRNAIAIAPSVTNSYRGHYQSSRGTVEISAVENALVMRVGGKDYTIYPESPTLFFSKERDLTFEFIVENGRTTKMVVRENGSIVDEARKTD